MTLTAGVVNGVRRSFLCGLVAILRRRLAHP